MPWADSLTRGAPNPANGVCPCRTPVIPSWNFRSPQRAMMMMGRTSRRQRSIHPPPFSTPPRQSRTHRREGQSDGAVGGPPASQSPHRPLRVVGLPACWGSSATTHDTTAITIEGAGAAAADAAPVGAGGAGGSLLGRRGLPARSLPRPAASPAKAGLWAAVAAMAVSNRRSQDEVRRCA